jgi:hypothetical protein
MTDYRETTGIGGSESGINSLGSGQTGAKPGDATLSGVSVSPYSVSPGGVIEVEGVVSENIIFMGYNDVDQCNFGPGTIGLRVEFEVTVPGLDRSSKATQCIAVWSATSGDHKFNVEIPIPEDAEDGDYEVVVKAILANSRNVAGEQKRTIKVSESGQSQPSCTSDADCGPGKRCVNGECVDTPPGDTNWTMWILNNPGKAAVLGVGGVVVINTVLN